MDKNRDIVMLDHGSGGKLSQDLVKNVFLKYFGAKQEMLTDSAILSLPSSEIAMTTDSYVVNPIFFPGGNIGKLAVCGTVNDLAVVGAQPMYLSCGFIIEEGFSLTELEAIVKTMAEEAKKAGVKIVTGDTKVVEKGSCDKIFINTAGIGVCRSFSGDIAKGSQISIGDKVIVSGYIAEHGMAIMAKRNGFEVDTKIKSDCASLNGLIDKMLGEHNEAGITFMRDATRGGVASILCEIVEEKAFGMKIIENTIPISMDVKGFCELLGFDPLYVANEGKIVVIVKDSGAQEILKRMQTHALGKEARIIGEITAVNSGKVILQTEIGGQRIVNMLAGAQLPRIC